MDFSGLSDVYVLRYPGHTLLTTWLLIL